MEGGLRSGARVAIVGGGVCGAAVAAALLNGARGRGLSLEVTVFEPEPRSGLVRPPVLLTPECRSRLAALGCRVPPDWRSVVVDGIEVISGERREAFPTPSRGLWVVDDWGPGETGTELARRALSASAALLGARFVPRAVQQVQWAAPPGAPPAEGPGPIALRSQGRVDRFDAAVLATGAGRGLSDRFFPGFEGAPAMPAVHARLRYPPRERFGRQSLKLLLSPVAGVDGLYLVPCGRSVHALAFGPSLTQAELCQALMVAARDGHLREGFELLGMRVGSVPFGAGARLTASGRLAVGPAACGHPLQLGLSEALSSCTRASAALLDAGASAPALRRRYVTDGIFDLLEDAIAGARAVGWLRRARELAPEAVQRARRKQPSGGPYSGGVLGLCAPTPHGLLGSARWAGVRVWLRSALLAAPEPGPGPPRLPERDLFYLVEDDPEVREALTSYLLERGAKVVAFCDELALFAAVAQRPPSAIVLDVVLSWVDGLTLCEGLKRHPLTRDARVLVTSGLDRPHIRTRALEAGAEAFLPKPLDPALLWALLTGRTAAGDGSQDAESARSA